MEKGMSKSTADPWKKLGLPNIINAAGKMTYLGSSAVADEVADAISFGAQSYVEMAALKTAAGRRIAELIGVPAACVVSCAAAGIVQSVAASITGNNQTLIERVPYVDIVKRDVIIQKSHAINYGAPITQMIRLGGGNVIEIGDANRCFDFHLETALNERTAAVLFVISHHVQTETAISLTNTILLAHRRGAKVIVDAAAETNLLQYVELGADLVIYSGHKAIGGPTSGIVIGDPTLIAACLAQETGVARAMKVSKEAIAGLICALERYLSEENTISSEELLGRLERVRTSVGEIESATFQISWDKTRPIPRLMITILENSPLTARQVVSRLESADPSIRTRNHDVDKGVINVDPREMTLDDAHHLGLALRQIFGGQVLDHGSENVSKQQ